MQFRKPLKRLIMGCTGAPLGTFKRMGTLQGSALPYLGNSVSRAQYAMSGVKIPTAGAIHCRYISKHKKKGTRNLFIIDTKKLAWACMCFVGFCFRLVLSLCCTLNAQW